MDLREAVSTARDAADHVGESNVATSRTIDANAETVQAMDAAITTAQHAVSLLSALSQFAAGTPNGEKIDEVLSRVSTDKDKLTQAMGQAQALKSLLEEIQESLSAAESEADDIPDVLNS